jgi:outer membrane protein OmpA-like peptidoglycan-associated protein
MHDGCPNKDADKDGIPTPADKCPDQPETVNGFEDDDGCPDKKPLVQLKDTEVQVNERINFDKGKAAIEPASMPVVEAVAEVLKQNPDLQLVEVAGHASKEGDEKKNLKLTQERVESVVKELEKKGIEKGRMLPQGYGAYCPIDKGESEESLDKNRRVEFKILYRKGKDLGQKRGCEEATKAGVKLKPVPKLKPEGAAAPAAKDAKDKGAGKDMAAKPGAAAKPDAAKPAAGAAAGAGAKPAEAAKPATPAKPAAPASSAK